LMGSVSSVGAKETPVTNNNPANNFNFILKSFNLLKI
jgi:hypothetical protein